MPKVVKRKIKRGIRISKYVIYKETLIDQKENFLSFLGAFLGVGIIAFCQKQILNENENVFLIGSFAASSVLIFGAIQSPLAQPRNLIGGHFISAILGVSIYKLLPDIIWLTGPLAVGLSIVAMQITKTLHPPGGATALIAVTGSAKIKALGYFYVLFPVLTGATTLLFIALIFNNLSPNRHYPSSRRIRNAIRMIFNQITFRKNR